MNKRIHAKDLVGKTFNFLYIENIKEIKNGNTVFVCRCLYKNCNKLFNVSIKNVRVKMGCGCLRHEKHINRITKHGRQKHPLYSIWYNFNDRCYDKKNCKSYVNYGGRGIYVCDEWKKGKENEQGLINFLNWCENNPRPNKLYSLDRIDNDGPYSPINCRWSTYKTQCNNRRNKKYYENIIKQKDLIINNLKKEIEKFKNE